jgi:hypothetical protein
METYQACWIYSLRLLPLEGTDLDDRADCPADGSSDGLLVRGDITDMKTEGTARTPGRDQSRSRDKETGRLGWG